MLRFDLLDAEALKHSSESSCAITPFAKRRSSPYLNKYEIARIVGERANQIINGIVTLNTSVTKCNDQVNDVFADHRGNAICIAEKCENPFAIDVDPLTVAKRELVQGEINMLIRRVWPDGSSEIIPVNELHLDAVYLDV